MTMHMIQGVNTSNTRKRKPKMTKGNMKRWAQEMQQYNKRARQKGEVRLSLDEYIDYVHGKGLPKKRKQEFVPMQYSGERKLMGIATMHKSNMVPVFEDADGKQYAKDLARMRRN